MDGSSLPFLMGLLLLLHSFVLVFSWLEKRLRPMMLRIGLINDEVQHLHQMAMTYHKMGVHVADCLREPPSLIPVDEARLLERRLFLECIAVSIGAMLPSGLFIAVSNT